MTSPSTLPLQLVTALDLIAVPASATSPASVDASQDLFNSLLAELLPAFETLTTESQEPECDDHARQLPAASPKSQRPAQTSKNRAEDEVHWLPDGVIPAAVICHPPLQFGFENLARTGPKSAGAAVSAAGQTSEAKSIVPSFKEVSSNSVSESDSPIRTPAPPIVLEGSMHDQAAQPEASIDAGHEKASPRAETVPLDGNEKNCSMKVPPLEEHLEAQQPANSENASPDQPDAESGRRQKPASTPRQEPKPAVVSDPASPSPHAYMPSVRSENVEQASERSTSTVESEPTSPITEPDLEVPKGTPRSVTVRIQETSGRPVDMRFVESNGSVKVTVRTEDTRLATSIATELPKFERGLESRGWSSEFNVSDRTFEAKPADEGLLSTRDAVQSQLPVAGADLANPDRNTDRRQQTTWDEEIEDRTVATALRRLSIQGAQR